MIKYKKAQPVKARDASKHFNDGGYIPGYIFEHDNRLYFVGRWALDRWVIYPHKNGATDPVYMAGGKTRKEAVRNFINKELIK